MNITSIRLTVPTDDAYWTNDPEDLDAVPNAVANYAAAADAYLRREYPHADIEIVTSPSPSCAVEVDGEPDEDAGAELKFEVQEAVDWRRVELWEDEFNVRDFFAAE